MSIQKKLERLVEIAAKIPMQKHPVEVLGGGVAGEFIELFAEKYPHQAIEAARRLKDPAIQKRAAQNLLAHCLHFEGDLEECYTVGRETNDFEIQTEAAEKLLKDWPEDAYLLGVKYSDRALLKKARPAFAYNSTFGAYDLAVDSGDEHLREWATEFFMSGTNFEKADPSHFSRVYNTARSKNDRSLLAQVARKALDMLKTKERPGYHGLDELAYLAASASKNEELLEEAREPFLAKHPRDAGIRAQYSNDPKLARMYIEKFLGCKKILVNGLDSLAYNLARNYHLDDLLPKIREKLATDCPDEAYEFASEVKDTSLRELCMRKMVETEDGAMDLFK